MTIDHMTTIDGRKRAGFFVRNRANKVLAIGAPGWVMPSRKRYARDISLCAALAKLTGQPVRWNLSYYGKHVSSHGEQTLMRIVRSARRFAL